MTLATLAVFTSAIVFFPGWGNVMKGIQSDVSTELFLLFAVVAIVAGVVKGMIGFGYALITTPIFASVIDPTLAVVVLAIPPWMINMFQIGETKTGISFVRQEWILVLLAIAGSITGVYFLAQYTAGPIVPFLIGVIIFAYVVFQVIQNFVTIEEAHHPVALSTAGFLEGSCSQHPTSAHYSRRISIRSSVTPSAISAGSPWFWGSSSRSAFFRWLFSQIS